MFLNKVSMKTFNCCQIGQSLIYFDGNIVQTCLSKRKCLDQFSFVKGLNYQMNFKKKNHDKR